MKSYAHYECIKIEKSGALATVTLNRPETRNAIDPQFHVELQSVWADLMDDAEVNAVLLTAAGRYFSIGGNIKGMQSGVPGGGLDSTFENGLDGKTMNGNQRAGAAGGTVSTSLPL